MKKINRKFVIILLAVLIVCGVIGGGIYWYIARQTIYIDLAQISAPTIALSPEIPGPLQEIMVNPGDLVNENTIVARIGDQLIKTKAAGLIINVNNDLGKIFNSGAAVATMIIPDQLRVVGRLDENKGLSQVQVGQRAVFTVDAFSSKKYNGTVDEISESARQGDVVFSISNKRPTNQFDIKIRFDADQYPELKNGMSAKIWIYKNGK
jgi:multidrug resistance efflux pump